jgi:anthranilate synthase component 1
MTEAEFKRLAAQGYNRVPVVLETCADLDTPLSVYLKLANRPNTYLLESVIGGERFGRYSFIGLATRTAVRAVGRHVTVLNGDRGKVACGSAGAVRGFSRCQRRGASRLPACAAAW